jgi:hypothetical protein
MKTNELLDEIMVKYSEWFEVAGEQSPALLVNILCNQVIKSKEMIEYLKKRVDNVSK